MTYEVKIEGLEEVRRVFAQAPDAFERELRKAMRQALDLVEEQVAGRTPVNVGQLRGSLATEIRGSGVSMQGIVGTPLIYGLPVEMGRQPGRMPPVDAIEYWVIRKRIALPPESRSVAFLIARRIGAGTSRGIMRPGGGARMFEKGLQASEGKIGKLFEDIPERVLGSLK